ncbi:MAG TPA: ABC transporter permease [Nocardioidaceae bacterium]|nr:ABC transporter permease [Nocardioidaceae bacterium]
MSAATTPAATTTRSGALNRIGRWVGEHLILFLGLLTMGYLLLPIGFVVLMSFNDPTSRLAYEFQGFTWDNWLNPCGPLGMCGSVVKSLQIGLLATVGATILGTLMSFALVRHRFRGRASTNLLIFLPMATPEVVMGSSLLALFTAAGLAGQLGFWSILVAHIMFCVSFVVVTVKARLQGMDSSLEQAAMDLYANEWQTFWRVTFPLVFPGILAAALLSFSLSFDDFIITNFNHGQTITFPMFVWGAQQRGIPPEVNVVGTLMFVAALVLVLSGGALHRRRGH